MIRNADLPVVARLLLGDYREAIGASDVRWLEHRRDRNDWIEGDAVRVKELLPAAAVELLTHHDDHDDYDEGEQR